MNDRIKQLAQQANLEITYDPTETPVRAFVECWEDELEKFAESIIRECASLSLTPMQISEAQYYHGWLNYRDEILKHFGLCNA